MSAKSSIVSNGNANTSMPCKLRYPKSGESTRVEPSRFSSAVCSLILLRKAAIYCKLKRHSDEIALIRRFANSHDIHFMAFSKRYRSIRVATYDWATKFSERIDAARLAATHAEEEDKRL